MLGFCPTFTPHAPKWDRAIFTQKNTTPLQRLWNSGRFYHEAVGFGAKTTIMKDFFRAVFRTPRIWPDLPVLTPNRLLGSKIAPRARFAKNSDFLCFQGLRTLKNPLARDPGWPDPELPGRQILQILADPELPGLQILQILARILARIQPGLRSWSQDSGPELRAQDWPPPTWNLLASISRRELATHTPWTLNRHGSSCPFLASQKT